MLTNSASLADVGRLSYHRLKASCALPSSGTVRVRPRLDARTTTSSRVCSARPGAIALRRRASDWRPRS